MANALRVGFSNLEGILNMILLFVALSLKKVKHKVTQ
jgi:hypothetical protein